MRYLFLLGVLPTTFGSLYTLGYSPLQIMVIGAYIVTSYFVFVEKHPNVEKDKIYQSIETVLASLSQHSLDDLEEDVNENEPLDGGQHLVNNDFQLSALLDEKSALFIKKFDSVMLDIFTSNSDVK